MSCACAGITQELEHAVSFSPCGADRLDVNECRCLRELCIRAVLPRTQVLCVGAQTCTARSCSLMRWHTLCMRALLLPLSARFPSLTNTFCTCVQAFVSRARARLRSPHLRSPLAMSPSAPASHSPALSVQPRVQTTLAESNASGMRFPPLPLGLPLPLRHRHHRRKSTKWVRQKLRLGPRPPGHLFRTP